MFILAICCWFTNNFSKLTTLYDAEGKGCGTDYPDYPYIYFVSPNYDVPYTDTFRLYGGQFVWKLVPSEMKMNYLAKLINMFQHVIKFKILTMKLLSISILHLFSEIVYVCQIRLHFKIICQLSLGHRAGKAKF